MTQPLTSDQSIETVEWLLKGNPVPAPHAVKMAMVRQFVEQSGYSTFVETGTYEGTTTAVIAEIGVNVFTIELSDFHYQDSKERLSRFENVTCLHGDSAGVIQEILPSLKAPAVFWLDGHYSEGTTALGSRVTPLVEELFYIFHHESNQHVVLIDDVRGFNGITYPTVEWVEQMVRLYWPDSKYDVLHDIMRIRPSHFVD